MPNTHLTQFQNKNTFNPTGEFNYTSMVSHRGTVVSFGMDSEARIKYTVLDLSGGEQTQIIDKNNWTGLQDLFFPRELSQSGFAVVKNYEMDLRGNLNRELTEEEIKIPSQIDAFHSSTAKLSANAPFQVLSDGKYIYLFRQALRGSDSLVDKILNTSTSNGLTTTTLSPIVNSTLLVDRFILSGTQLVLSREIRYQRSRHKTQPASRKDTLASVDMDKNPFYEPTRELTFAKNLINGGFSVLLIPTQETEVQRWQIFYYNSRNKRINSVSIKMDADGWFDSTEAEEYVQQFMEENGLGDSFLNSALDKIKGGFYDIRIATDLKGSESSLSSLSEEEIAEVVYAIRTGVIKDDFSLDTYVVETGMSSIFYYQQEFEANGKPMKTNANVMLALGLKKQTREYELGVLSFAVSNEGRLSRLSKENLVLPDLDLASIDIDSILTRISELEITIGTTRGEIDDARQEFISSNIIAEFLESANLPLPTGPPFKPLSAAMISPYYSEAEVNVHTTNLVNVQTAINETNARRDNYSDAITDLETDFNFSKDGLGPESGIISVAVDVHNDSYEIEYEYGSPAFFGEELGEVGFDGVAYFDHNGQQQRFFFRDNLYWHCIENSNRWSHQGSLDLSNYNISAKIDTAFNFDDVLYISSGTQFWSFSVRRTPSGLTILPGSNGDPWDISDSTPDKNPFYKIWESFDNHYLGNPPPFKIDFVVKVPTATGYTYYFSIGDFYWLFDPILNTVSIDRGVYINDPAFPFADLQSEIDAVCLEENNELMIYKGSQQYRYETNRLAKVDSLYFRGIQDVDPDPATVRYEIITNGILDSEIEYMRFPLNDSNASLKQYRVCRFLLGIYLEGEAVSAQVTAICTSSAAYHCQVYKDDGGTLVSRSTPNGNYLGHGTYYIDVITDQLELTDNFALLVEGPYQSNHTSIGVSQMSPNLSMGSIDFLDKGIKQYTATGPWDKTTAASKSLPNRYARFYQLSTDRLVPVKMSLSSSNTTPLLQVFSMVNGAPVLLSNLNSGAELDFSLELAAGDYLIEATTTNQNIEGNFSLFVEVRTNNTAVASLEEIDFIPSVNILKDDRPTLEILRVLENTLLSFYHLIKGKLTDLSDAQIDLDEERKKLSGRKSSVKMQVIEMDPNGLLTSGGLLKFGYGARQPSLFDDSLGRVSLYFSREIEENGEKSQSFYVAYFNPDTSQVSTSDHDDQPGLYFEPRFSMAMKLEVSCTTDIDTCLLLIKDKNTSQLIEQWNALPRSSAKVAEILNGNGQFNLGDLSRDYKKGEGIITIVGQADHPFIPSQKANLAEGLHSIGQDSEKLGFLSEDYSYTEGKLFIRLQGENTFISTQESDFAGLDKNDELEIELPTYFQTNRILLVDDKQFSIKEDSKVTLRLWEASQFGKDYKIKICFEVDELNFTANDFLNAGWNVFTIPTVEKWFVYDLPRYFIDNPTLLVGNQEFSIPNKTVKLKAGSLLKADISAVVNTPDHIQKVWDLMIKNGIIKESGIENRKKGTFISKHAFGDKSAIKDVLQLGRDLKYIEGKLILLIMKVAASREIQFEVSDKNIQEVEVALLETGLQVQTMYDYSNYICTPNNLAGVTIQEWKHNKSFLFKASSGVDIDMQNFTLQNYATEEAIGQWETYAPGLAISFDRALEVQAGVGATGLITTNDTNKLHKLAPTAQGLSMEAWIKPELETDFPSSSIIHYKNASAQYRLWIENDGDEFKALAVIGGRKLTTENTFSYGGWRHLALSYKKYWALELSQTSVNCGNDSSLSIEGEYSLEILLRPDSNGTILSKGDEYSLKLNNGILAFEVVGGDVLAGNGLTLTSGKFHKVTLVKSQNHVNFQLELEQTTADGNSSGSGNQTSEDWWLDADGNAKSNDEILAGMAARQGDLLKKAEFVQDNMLGDTDSNETGNDYYYSLIIQEEPFDSNTPPQTFSSGSKTNRAASSRFSNLHLGGDDFAGTFDEVRIWNRSLSTNEVKSLTISGDKTSLLSWWRFAEGEGKYVYDDASRNHGVVETPNANQWIASPNSSLNRFSIFVDGNLESFVEAGSALTAADNQFSLGGYKQGNVLHDHFNGTLEEIRIWGLPRSEEEISDNVFSRLKGETEKLLANYTFDTHFSTLRKDALTNLNGITDSEAAQIWDALETANIIRWDGILVTGQAVTDPIPGLRAELGGLSLLQEDLQAPRSLNPTEIDAIVDVFDLLPIEVQDSGYHSISLTVEGQVYSGMLGNENINQVLSTAPVSTEIPVVRSALAGVRTEYHGQISSRPALVEYGDVQDNEDGTLNGILKRCYSFIDAGKWHLVTGYKVGNLVTEWYGQAQFDPQIVGYLEGAPPVPGENFPIVSDADINIYAYRLNNSISFEQADEVSFNYSTSKEAGYNVSVETEAFSGTQFETVIAPFGVGILLKGKIGSKSTSNWETNGKRSQSYESGVSINTDRSLSASLAGYDNGKTGDERYYKFGNTGYALVKSKTADIYLLRLAHNNALVSAIWRPNPDIPEDTNIIPFPINPLYVKQGTLDGKSGDKPDEHFPLAQAAYGENSYFKPKEAYRLKDRIEKEKEKVRAYFEDVYDPAKTGAAFDLAAAVTGGLQSLGSLPFVGPTITSVINSTAGQAATQIGYDNSNIIEDLAKVASQRNLVNTYVWTMEGGFYAESTQLAETFQEVYNNETSLNLGGGGGWQMEVDTGTSFEQSFISSTGSSLTLTKTKTKKSSSSFGLNVSVDIPTSPRYRYDGLTRNKIGIKPGTVDAYRFMSFYLEPQTENYVDLFTQVIDPKWLEESPDPNAVAMRQARNDDAKPFCWRIMHRVTYVSRIIPDFNPEDPPSLESLMRTKNIESNYMLIKLFEPFIRNISRPGAFRNEVNRIIDLRLQEFAEYRTEIIAYLELYYGIV